MELDKHKDVRNDLKESIIHGLRSQGWSRIEAETEAEDRLERIRQKNSGVEYTVGDKEGRDD